MEHDLRIMSFKVFLRDILNVLLLVDRNGIIIKLINTNSKEPVEFAEIFRRETSGELFLEPVEPFVVVCKYDVVNIYSNDKPSVFR